MQLKQFVSRSLRWLGLTVFALVMLVVGAFGMLQTSIGLKGIGGLLADLVSSPAYSVTLNGLDGSFPFDMRARRIEISDDRGRWLTLKDVHLDLAATRRTSCNADVQQRGRHAKTAITISCR